MELPASLKGAFRGLLPGWCYQCGCFLAQAGRKGEQEFLCPDCLEQLPYFLEKICPSCGHFHRLSECDENWSMHLDGYRAIFLYVDPLMSWLGRFKYGPNLLAGRVLKRLTEEHFQRNPQLLQEDQLLLPIPSHPAKLKARGFNSAAMLLDFPLAKRHIGPGLIKVKNLKAQASLDKEHRQSNLRGAFASKPEWVAGKRILLFDDVCTTGSTLDEAALTLKRAGAARVEAISLCRTLEKR